MTRPVTADDLAQIAAELSAHLGTVSTSAFGVLGSSTIYVRPGARTVEGRAINGEACARALGDDFEVFPLAVEYGLDELDDALGGMDAALDDLEDSLGAAKGKGRVSLRKRYSRVVARYRRVMSKLASRPRKGRERRADRRYTRMVRLWQTMIRKGVNTSGLPSPEQVRAEFAPSAPQRVMAPPSAVPVMGPVSTAPSPGYFQDQRELEQEMEALMPKFGAEEERQFGAAALDLDAALGALDEAVEGAEDEPQMGRDLSKRYNRVVNRYRRLAGKVAQRPAPRRRAALARRFARMARIWSRMSPASRSGLPSPAAVRAEVRQERREAAFGGSRELPSDVLAAYAAAQEALRSDLRCSVPGYGLSELEHDYYGVASSDVEVVYSDPDLAAGDPEDDAEIDDDADDADDVGGDDAELLGAEVEIAFGGRLGKLKRWARKGAVLTPRQARRVARWRSRWQAALSRAKSARRQARLRQRISLANELLLRSAATYGATDGEGVDAGRLRPKTQGAPGEPVLVIGLRRRSAHAQPVAVAMGSFQREEAQPSQVHPLDVMAAGMSQVYRVNNGYSAPEAMAAITEWTHPADWIYGEEVDALPYPIGNAAPLPPPRHAGNEVV